MVFKKLRNLVSRQANAAAEKNKEDVAQPQFDDEQPQGSHNIENSSGSSTASVVMTTKLG